MSTPTFTTPHSSRIKEIFTGITPQYDFLNSLLSLRLDRSWRKWAVDNVLTGAERSILDIGTGTGKFLESFLHQGHFEKICAVDLCETMLEKAKKTVPDPRIIWLNADISQGIPLDSESFDLVTAAFTLRSIQDLSGFFAEVKRVLNHGGKVAFLELTRPHHPGLKLLYYPYLKFYLPLVGALVSKSFQAYSFLSNSILHFDEPEKIKGLLEKLGFSSVKIDSYTGGIATLIRAVKA